MPKKTSLPAHRHPHSQRASFAAAWAGITWNVLHEAHMLFHLTAMIAVTLAGIFFSLARLEWLVLILLFALIPALELVNSAVELTCDIIRDTLELDYEATRLPRDLAAGAVLWASIAAVVIGVIIFAPHAAALLGGGQ